MSRASCTIAFFAPLAIALRCTASRSPVAPRSPVQVTTSKPSVSRSQATATDVSSPPLYARTHVSFAYRRGFTLPPQLSPRVLLRDAERGETPEQALGFAIARRRDEDSVVSGERANDVGEPRRVERRGEGVRGARK